MDRKGYDALTGHDDAVRFLVSAAKKDRVSHAWIFQGEKGCGKGKLAFLFAMALLCEEKDGLPCMACRSCRRAEHGNHPDIITVKPEKTNTLSVDDIRQQVAKDASVKPYESRYKIYIIPEADRMTVQAQNALLKTLEEPPAYCIILLLASNADAFLPTITSRSITLNLRPVRDSLVKEYLVSNYGMREEDAALYAAFARGNIGRAKLLASDEAFASRTEESISYLTDSRRLDAAEQLDFVKKMTADKKEIDFYLELMTMWFRDVLLYKASGNTEDLIFADRKEDIIRRAGESSYEGLGRIIEELKKVNARLRANVNTELTLELLTECIRDN